MKQLKQGILKTILIILAFFLIYYFFLYKYLTLENLKQHALQLLKFKNENLIATVIAFILSSILIAIAPIPGETILGIAGGFLFGTVIGFFLSTISILCGALIIYYLARTLIGKYAFNNIAAFRKIKENFHSHDNLYILGLRLIPTIPFFVLNYFCGIIGQPIIGFIITTIVGIMPITLVRTLAGHNLNNILNVGEIISWPKYILMIAIGALTILIAIILHKKRTNKSHNKNFFN